MENFENRGYSLEDMGIYGYAYRYNDVLLYIEQIRLQNKIILGGDVFINHDGKLELTYDNWYYVSENTEQDSLKSISTALEYIQWYIKIKGDNTYFQLVLSD